MRHDRRCFGRLEQEDQRLKKHYDHWMDILRPVELESCKLTKLTKPSIPVNLVGPQVILPLWWVPSNRVGIHFFVRNKEALPFMRRYSWWVRHVNGRNIFFTKYRGPSGGSQLSGGGIIICAYSPRPHTRKCLLITRKIMIPPPDIWDPPEGPLYFVKKMFPPLTGRTHQLYLRTQGSAFLLRTKNEYPLASWDPP